MGSKKLLGLKRFLGKNFGSKKILGLKKLVEQKNVCPKRFWVHGYVDSKNVWVQKNVGSKTNCGSKKSVGSSMGSINLKYFGSVPFWVNKEISIFKKCLLKNPGVPKNFECIDI